MIPLAVPAALKAVPWKLVGTAVVLVALFAFVLLILHWRRDSVERLPAAQEALEREIKCGEGSECLKRVAAVQAAQKVISDEAEQEYRREIAKLANRPLVRRVVRVCADAGPGDVRDAAAAEGSAGTAPGGVLHGPRELDTGPLRDAAAKADAINAAYRFIYNRDRALSQVEK